MAPTLSDFAVRGPHPVGVTTLQVADPERPGRVLPVDLWYPARPRGAPGLPLAEHPFGRPHDAFEAPPAAEGAFPLLGFSHGNAGLRRQSTFLTTHLASFGFVVAAPDHVGNTFPESIRIRSEEERQRVHFEARASRPADLALALDAARSGAAPARIAEGPVGVLGHSFGGWTVLKMPGRDPRIGAVCGLAPASEPFVGRKAFAPGELPFARTIPTLLVAGLDDVLVDLDTSVRPLFRRLGAPRSLVGVRDADHFHFCDGIELLHGMHEQTVRPRQTRQARPYAEQLPEPRMHRLLQALVAAFFHGSLVAGDADPLAGLEREALARLDEALVPVDATVDAA